MPRLGLAGGVDAQERRREVDCGALGRLPGLLPAAGADAAELRPRLAQPDVTADEMRLLQRDVQRHPIVEFERDHLAGALRGVEFREPAIECDAVLQVDDEVAFDQLGEIEELVDLRA